MLKELLALLIAGIVAIALVEAADRRALRRHRNHPSNRSRRYE